MIKTLSITFFVIVTSFFNTVQEETITASYDKFEDGEYYFTSASENYTFQGIAETASGKYNLIDKQYVGKTFTLTYKTNVISEPGEDDYKIYIITVIALE